MDHESLLATAASLSSIENIATQESAQTSSATVQKRITAAYDSKNPAISDGNQAFRYGPSYSQPSLSQLGPSQLSSSHLTSSQQTTLQTNDSVDGKSNKVLMEKVKTLQDITGVDENTATYLLEVTISLHVARWFS